MRPSLRFAVPFLFSIALHAAVTGIGFWNDSGAPAPASPEVWLEDTKLATPPSAYQKHRPKPKSIESIPAQAKEPVRPIESASASNETAAVGTTRNLLAQTTTANEIFDLSSPQSHPYFDRLRRHLSEAKRGLAAADGHSEQFSIQLGIRSSGEITNVQVAGEESRLKLELSQRMARIAFLPALPEDILLGKQRIEIRYRVLFSQ